MNKKNLILGGVLAILIALAFLYSGPVKEWRENLGRPDNFLSQLDFAQVDYIAVADKNKSVELEKVGDRWRIAGTKDFYLKDNVINAVTGEIDKAVKSEIEIVGENMENKKSFETDDESGVKVALRQGENVLEEIIVGKNTPDFQGTYISRPGTSETYSVKANLRLAFNRSDWYNKTIFEGEKDNINKLRFQYPTREFTVEKKEEGWTGTLPYEFRVDEDKIDNILNIMSNLTAAEIPEQTFEGTGLEKNLIIVQATGENIDNTIMVGDPKPVPEGEEPSFYYAKKGNSDNIYLIEAQKRDDLDQTIRSLR